MTVLPLVVDWGHTWLVTGVGFGMVFVLLVVLIMILKLFGSIMKTGNAPKKADAPKAAAVAAAAPAAAPAAASEDEDLAAVAMAIHLYFGGVHDEEPTEITLRNIERRYSPWNDKAYGMNNLHR